MNKKLLRFTYNLIVIIIVFPNVDIKLIQGHELLISNVRLEPVGLHTYIYGTSISYTHTFILLYYFIQISRRISGRVEHVQMNNPSNVCLA